MKILINILACYGAVMMIATAVVVFLCIRCGSIYDKEQEELKNK